MEVASVLGVLLAVLLPFSGPQALGDCSDLSYAELNPEVCAANDCSDAIYAELNPEVCGITDKVPTVAITVTQNAAPGSAMKVSVSGSDDVDVDRLILYDGSGAQVDSFACPSGAQKDCKNDFTVTAPSTYSTSYSYKAKSKDSAGQLSDFAVASGVTTPAPVCAPGSERWGATPESMPLSTCPSGWTTHARCSDAGQWVLVECIQPTEEPSVPPVPLDASPSVSITVPPSAAPGAALAITVTATDDSDVAQLLLFSSADVQIASFDCLGVQTVCSNVFAAAAPATPATAYTFKAKGKDNAGKVSAVAVGSGVTTAAPVAPPVVPPVIPPVVPPVAPPVSAAPVPLDVVSVSFPLQPLFMRSVGFADSDCVKPGESAILAVKVQNKGREALKDVRFTASVPELGIYASDGPVKLTAKDKSTRFLQVDVPEDAENGAYMLRFTVSNNKFKRSVHRDFVVGSNC